jgi:YbgC/YbaW family acyl-CoA thioester hydrolase
MSSHQIFKYQTMIKESHLDSFGHVNNAIYLQLYEEARWDFITKNGFGLEVIQRTQKGPVLLDLSVKFKRELKNREVIVIQSQAVEIINSKMLVLEQKMIRADGKIASEARFTVGFFDLQARKLIDADPLWLQAVGIHV